MATEAQTNANCENAQYSTGPQTPQGKLHSSRNSLKFGLFSTKNCVLPEETREYSDLSRSLWESLNPLGAVEEMFAVEIIRGAWRLRRCASTEATLAEWDSRQVLDPMCYDSTASTQASVDRARTQATGVLQRTMAELRRLQTERWTRSEALPADFDSSNVGIAASKHVIETLSVDANRKMAAGKVASNENFWAAIPSPLVPKQTDPGAKQTRSHSADPVPIARNAPCPCGSRLKYKRCCGKTAPAILHAAA
jgi:hypothetical protein